MFWFSITISEWFQNTEVYDKVCASLFSLVIINISLNEIMDVTKTEHKRNNLNHSENLLYQIVFTEWLLLARRFIANKAMFGYCQVMSKAFFRKGARVAFLVFDSILSFGWFHVDKLNNIELRTLLPPQALAILIISR